MTIAFLTQHDWASGNYYELDTDGTVASVNFESFARAILRKAQEK